MEILDFSLLCFSLLTELVFFFLIEDFIPSKEKFSLYGIRLAFILSKFCIRFEYGF